MKNGITDPFRKHNDIAVADRVTRLGELSLIGAIVFFGQFFNYQRSLN
jgi:hypothetical protein